MTFRFTAEVENDRFISTTYSSREEAVRAARQMWPILKSRHVTEVAVIDSCGEPETLWRAPTPAAKLRPGYYAVDGKRYVVSRSTGGKWAGWTFVATGSDYHDRKTLASVRPDGSVARDHHVLTAICADPFARAAEYGQVTGKCAACGRKLEDPVSRSIGMGPVCREKWGC